MTSARRALVDGEVQGVGFRWSCARRAEQLGVAGWVANRPDGRVEVVAEGSSAALDALVAWLHEGPRFARVSRVDVVEVEPTGLTGFVVEP